MADITMSLDDTLELDAIIQKWNDPNNIVSDDDNNFNMSGFQTNTRVLEPQDSGTYNITVNGQTLTIEVIDNKTISDSVVAHYDASIETSTGGITSINDQVNSFNLTGNASIISNGINGKTSYRFNGSEKMSTDTSITSSDPIAVLAVAQRQNSSTGTNNTMLDGNQRHEFSLNENGGSDWMSGRGTSYQSYSGTLNTNPHVYELVGTQSNKIEAFLDGTSMSGIISASSSQLSGFHLASFGDGDNPMEVDIGEVVIMDNTSQSEIDSERKRLADKWSITI